MEAVKLRDTEQIYTRLTGVREKIDYLSDFLQTCYKGSDVKPKVERELAILRKEEELLEWFLNVPTLPF